MIYKTIIIGLGNIGFGYDRDTFYKSKKINSHAKALIKHKNYKLVAGIDIDYKKRKEFQELLKINTYNSYTNALKYTKVDCVIISTSTQNHYKCFQEIISISKPRIILFEKPITYNYSEFLKIYNNSKKLDIKLFVNYFRVYDPGFLKLKKIIINRKIINKKNNGYVIYSKKLIHSGSHFLNLIEYLFNDKIYDVKILKKHFLKKDKDGFFDLKFKIRKSEFYFISNNNINNDHNYLQISNNSEILSYFNENNLIKNLSIKNGKTNFITNNLNIYQYNVIENIRKYMLNKRNNSVCLVEDLTNISKIFNKLIKS